MSLASRPASRWAVSTRASGEVLTVGIRRSELELSVLGVPSGFSPVEVESWLHDLAGVAVETSRADTRARAIPALMHHALSGLLFSHAELWDRLESPRPCSCAFVDLPEGAAFGWVGEARAHVLVNGDPVEPQWVRVRDDAGREGRAAVFAPGSDVVVTLGYWPQGEAEGAPPASLEAEWNGEAGVRVSAPPAAVAAAATPAWPPPETARAAAPPAPRANEPEPALPESLPLQQPGLAAAAVALPREPSAPPELVVPLQDRGAAGVARPADIESVSPLDILLGDDESGHAAGVPAAGEEPLVPAMAGLAPPAPEAVAAEAAIEAAPAAAAEPVAAEPRAAHPVARWLSRVMNWGRAAAPPEPPAEVAAVAEPFDESAPVSAYDSLLSEPVPDPEPRQVALELPPGAAGAPLAIERFTPESAIMPPAAPAPLALEPLAPAPLAPPAQPVAAEPAARPPVAPAVARPSVSMLRPAGLADILGARAAATPAPSEREARPAAPEPPAVQAAPAREPIAAAPEAAPPPAGPSRREPALVHAESPAGTAPGADATQDRLASLLREIEAADAAQLPVLSPAIPEGASRRPLDVDHEPVGADETFGIPPLPDALRVGPPGEDRFADIAPLPPGRAEAGVAAAGASLDDMIGAGVPLPLDAPAEEPAAGAPAASAAPEAPPVLRVEVPEREGDAEEAGDPLFPVSARRVRPLETPEPPAKRKLKLPPRAGWWAAGIVAVFVLGWLVGGLSNPGADRGGPVMAALRAIGLGGARFTLEVNSSPGGATIEVDGRVHPARTPATLELPPGEHVVRLGMPGLGSVEVPVKGRRGERKAIDEPLNGSLEIVDADAKVPIRVSIDGRPAGYAPLRVESIAPGLHEVGFSGPGMAAWAQTVQVEVRGATQLVARPMTAPANGVLQVQATINDERGASPLSGAQVYVDGELRGTTPLTLELPRGPHSLRVTWRGETAPIQVIELPGGNQRYASFQFGLDLDAPRLSMIDAPKTFAKGQPKLVSASVEGLTAEDVGEAWLHVRTPEGLWRRSAMTVMRAPGGLVVSSVFPDNVFDRQGATRWYVRVVTHQGDETFSEVQHSGLAGAGAAERPRP